MADQTNSLVAGLFGLDPYQIQQQRNQQAQDYAAKVAGMDGFQAAKFGIGQGAAGLTRGIAGMMGMVDPMEQEAQEQQAMLQGVDMSDPASIRQRALQIQDPKVKLLLGNLADQIESRNAETELNKAHAAYYGKGGASSGSSQKLAKLSIARNDALKAGINGGLSGQELMDFVDQQVQAVANLWDQQNPSTITTPAVAPNANSTMTDNSAIPLSDNISISNDLKITQEQKDLMIEEATKMGDMKAVEAIKKLPVEKPPVFLQSKAKVAGDVKLAQTTAEKDPMLAAREAAAKETGKGSAESRNKFYQQASDADVSVQKLDRVINEIDNSSFRPGAFADLRTSINKAIALLGGREAAKNASDSEIMDALLGQDVFNLMGALGLGSKQMDTPAEREFMREVLAGTRTMERSSLKRLAEIRKADAQSTIDRFNSEVDSGSWDDWFKQSGRPKKKFGVNGSVGGEEHWARINGKLVRVK